LRAASSATCISGAKSRTYSEGLDDFEHLQKLKIVEHLVFLAQLDELRVMNTARG
jgi:hypothetical protein